MPFARLSDPQTSHAAAASISREELRDSQKAVYDLLVERGQMNDEAISSAYSVLMRDGHVPYQSESGLRTRRSELVTLGLVVDTGLTTRMRSGRMSIIWKAA